MISHGDSFLFLVTVAMAKVLRKFPLFERGENDTFCSFRTKLGAMLIRAGLRKRQQEPVTTPLRSPHRPARTCSRCFLTYMITLNTARLQHHRYCMGEGQDFP